MTNPWADMIGTDVIWVAGSNVAECSPITTNYLWQAREHGARIIIQDPRLTPVARTCDLFLPVKPGRDAALFAGVLQIMIERGWIDQRLHRRAHGRASTRSRRIAASGRSSSTAEVTGVPRALDRAGGGNVGARRASGFMLHARGIEHHSNGVQNTLGSINLVLATGRIGRPHCGYGTIVGQANGQGGREHGQKCDQLPGMARHLESRSPRATSPASGASTKRDLPGPGVDAYEMFRKIDAGEIKGLISICFNPKVSLPDNHFVTRCLDKLEFYVAIDFFLNDTARHADIVLPGSLHEEDEGTVTQVEGRIIKVNKAVDCPGEARQDWRIIQDIARALDRPHGFTFDEPREIFEELRIASKGGVADYSGVTYEKIEREMGVFWPCYAEDPRTGEPIADHPGTPRLFEPGSYNPIAKGAGRSIFPTAAPASTSPTTAMPVDDVSDEYPIFLTTGRVVSQFLSGTQTRRIGPLVKQYPEPRIETASAARREARHRRPRLDDGRDAPRHDHAARDGRQHHPARHHLHSVSLGRQEERQPADGGRAGSDQQDPAIQGVRLPRPQGRRPARLRRRAGAAAVKPDHLQFFIDPSRCIGCQSCVQACTECDTHRGESMIHLEYRRSRRQRADRAGGVHALRAADLRRGLPGRRHQADRRRRRPVGAQAALHRLRQLRGRLPVRRARGLRRSQADDEVRHVLRPHQHRQEADVRDGVPEPGAVLRHRGGDRAAAPEVGAGQSLPVRQPDDHDARLRDVAARPGDAGARCSTSPRRSTSAPAADPFAHVEI